MQLGTTTECRDRREVVDDAKSVEPEVGYASKRRRYFLSWWQRRTKALAKIVTVLDPFYACIMYTVVTGNYSHVTHGNEEEEDANEPASTWISVITNDDGNDNNVDEQRRGGA